MIVMEVEEKEEGIRIEKNHLTVNASFCGAYCLIHSRARLTISAVDGGEGGEGFQLFTRCGWGTAA